MTTQAGEETDPDWVVRLAAFAELRALQGRAGDRGRDRQASVLAPRTVVWNTFLYNSMKVLMQSLQSSQLEEVRTRDVSDEPPPVATASA